MSSNEMMSFEEARVFLGVSRTTLHRVIASKELRGLKVGGQWRFRPEDLAVYLERKPAGVVASALPELEAELQFWRELAGESETLDGDADDATAEQKIAAIAKALLQTALARGTSDIHLEPSVNVPRVRFREDGVLHTIRELPASLFVPLETHFKALGNMNQEEKIRPQEGWFEGCRNGRAFMLRLSTLPALAGESLVIRILKQDYSIPALDQYSISGEDIARLRQLMTFPNGLVLVAGPSGSGKTTLAYSLLLSATTAEVKAIALEDPVELNLPGVVSVNVKKAPGLTFAAMLRAVMRQDPDLIFVGETQDAETAQQLIQAAMTGHLALTTLPVAGAAEAVATLTSLGNPPFMVAAAVVGAVGQRLVRALCKACAVPVEPAEKVVALARARAAAGGYQVPREANWRGATGCPQCRQSGFRGRLPVVEVLVVDEPLRAAITRGEGATALRKRAIANGMKTLFADGVRRAVLGETTLEEVFRSVAPGEEASLL